jgi:micrococcal nuclease
MAPTTTTLLALALLLGGCGAAADRGEPAPSRGVPQEAERVVVEYVVDGDTVVVNGAGGERTVRLLEIDAPESKDRDQPVQCFAVAATRALRRLLPVGSVARVLADRDPIDRYGRSLLYVWNRDGVLVNERLVRRGFARAVLFEPNDLHIDRMRRAEERARADRAGLWGACPYFGAPAG